MHPVLYEFANFKIYTFGVMILLSVLLGLLLLKLLSKIEDIDFTYFLHHIVKILLVSLFVSRLFHVILEFDRYKDHLLYTINPRDGGLSMWGFILGVYLSLYYLTIRFYNKRGKIMDCLSVVFVFISSFLFLGQYFAGQGFGETTDFFMGVNYENINSPYIGVTVHPTSLYMSIACFILFLLSLLLIVFRKKLYNSFIFYLNIILFLIAHIITESLRWDLTYVKNGYNIDKVISIVVLTITSVFFLYSFISIYGSQIKDRFKNRNF